MLASPETLGDQPLQRADHMQQPIWLLTPQIYLDPKDPICKAAEILEHGKVQNAEWSYTEVLWSWISRTMESTSSVGSGLGFNLCVAPLS